MTLDPDEVFDIILKAYEEKATDMLWHQYNCLLPHMNPEKIISFNEYKKSIFEPPREKKHLSEGEILMDVKDIIDQFSAGRR